MMTHTRSNGKPINGDGTRVVWLTDGTAEYLHTLPREGTEVSTEELQLFDELFLNDPNGDVEGDAQTWPPGPWDDWNWELGSDDDDGPGPQPEPDPPAKPHTLADLRDALVRFLISLDMEPEPCRDTDLVSCNAFIKFQGHDVKMTLLDIDDMLEAMWQSEQVAELATV